MRHRRGDAVELLVIRQRRVDDVLPAAEPDKYVHPHRHESLEPVRHRRDLDPEQFFRDGRRELAGSLQGRLRLPGEHRTVDREVVIVRPVQGVEVHRAASRPELLVGRDRSPVGGHHPPVVAAQHVDVRGHVPQVAGVRYQVPQQVAGPQRLLRLGRPLHQVDVHVQDSGVGPAGVAGQRALQHRLRLGRGRPGGWFARHPVPQRPRREVHQGVGQQRGDIKIVRMPLVCLPHGGRVSRVPGRAVHGRLGGRIPGVQSRHEGPFDG
jgi:hypothetical protein